MGNGAWPAAAVSNVVTRVSTGVKEADIRTRQQQKMPEYNVFDVEVSQTERASVTGVQQHSHQA
jgi:hypothetical protein